MKTLLTFLRSRSLCPALLPSMLLPFLATGWGGLKGSLVATIGVVLPSFVIIFVIVTAFTSSGFDQYPNILKFFDGINSAITALLIAATLKLIPYSIKNNFGWFILAFSLLGIYFFSLDIAIIVLLASALGYCATKYLGSDTK